MGWVRERIEALRDHERSVVFLGMTFGLGVATGHYVGMILGGGIVGLAARSMRRALLYGLGFGLLVWLVFVGSLALNGMFLPYVGMGQLTLLSVASAFLLPALAALATRGLT